MIPLTYGDAQLMGGVLVVALVAMVVFLVGKMLRK